MPVVKLFDNDLKSLTHSLQANVCRWYLVLKSKKQLLSMSFHDVQSLSALSSGISTLQAAGSGRKQTFLYVYFFDKVDRKFFPLKKY